jgi:type II secretory pathway component PulM
MTRERSAADRPQLPRADSRFGLGRVQEQAIEARLSALQLSVAQAAYLANACGPTQAVAHQGECNRPISCSTAERASRSCRSSQMIALRVRMRRDRGQNKNADWPFGALVDWVFGQARGLTDCSAHQDC